MTHDPTAAALDDPSTSPAELARLAAERPDLRARIAAHPAAYPELLGWLAAQGDPAVAAAVAARGAAPQQAAQPTVQPAVQPAAQPTVQPATPDAFPSPTGPVAAVVPQDGVDAPGAEFAPVGAQPRRRRTGLWVGVAVAAVAVVGAGGYAAWATVLSKLGGAASPEAAVTQLVEGVADKDGVAVYGVLSPSEVGSFRDAFDGLDGLDDLAGDGRSVDPEKLRAALDALAIDIEGLDLQVEEVDEGLAKVSIAGGTLTVDADAAELTDLAIEALTPVLEAYGQPVPTGDERDEAVQQIDDALPWSLDAAELTWDAQGEEQLPFLMAVEEGGDWYVSPLMTIGEYVTVAQGGTRGAMPSDDGAALTSAKDAGVAFTEALAGISSGDMDTLSGTLAEGERRFMDVYVSQWVGDLSASDTVVTVDEASFDSRDLGSGRQLLQPRRVALSGDGETVVVEGTCATTTGGDADGEKRCIADNQGLVELGLEDLGLVAVEEDGGYRVSVLATVAHAYGTMLENLVRLQKDGKLEDQQWLEENFGDLSSSLGMGALGGLGGLATVPELEGLDDLGGSLDDEWTYEEEDGDIDVGGGSGDGTDPGSGDGEETWDWDEASWAAQSDLYSLGIEVSVYYVDPSASPLTPNALSIEGGRYVLTTGDGSKDVSEVTSGAERVTFDPGSNDGTDFCVGLELDGGAQWSYTPQGGAVEGACS